MPYGGLHSSNVPLSSSPTPIHLLGFVRFPIIQVCNRTGMHIRVEIQKLMLLWLWKVVISTDWSPLTSVWTICGRWLRILETNSKTSTFCSVCIMSIMASITMNVPVRPTPALEKETKTNKKSQWNHHVCRNCHSNDTGRTYAVYAGLKYSPGKNNLPFFLF